MVDLELQMIPQNYDGREGLKIESLSAWVPTRDIISRIMTADIPPELPLSPPAERASKPYRHEHNNTPEAPHRFRIRFHDKSDMLLF